MLSQVFRYSPFSWHALNLNLIENPSQSCIKIV